MSYDPNAPSHTGGQPSPDDVIDLAGYVLAIDTEAGTFSARIENESGHLFEGDFSLVEDVDSVDRVWVEEGAPFTWMTVAEKVKDCRVMDSIISTPIVESVLVFSPPPEITQAEIDSAFAQARARRLR